MSDAFITRVDLSDEDIEDRQFEIYFSDICEVLEQNEHYDKIVEMFIDIASFLEPDKLIEVRDKINSVLKEEYNNDNV